MIPLVFVLAIALAGCKTVAKGDHFEAEITTQIKAKGHDVVVDCPGDIPLGVVETNHFDCEIREATGTVTMVKVRLDAAGGWGLQVLSERRAAGAPALPETVEPRPPDDDDDPWN